MCYYIIMKIFVFFITLFITISAYAQSNDDASKYLAKAVLKTDTGKRIEKKLKAFAEVYVNKEASAAIIAGTSMAVEGKIDTNKINYKMKFSKKGYVKPYIVHDIKENQTTGILYMRIDY